MERRTFLLLLASASITPMKAVSQAKPARVDVAKLEQILKKEAERNLEKLSKEQVPAYYIAYRVYDTISAEGNSTFGELSRPSVCNRMRWAQVQLRVGSPALDNTHEVKGDDSGAFYNSTKYVRIPLEDNEKAISTALWLNTDEVYKKAVIHFQKVQSQAVTKVASEDKAPDFSTEKREVYHEKPYQEKDVRKYMSELDKRIALYSSYFNSNKELTDGNVSYNVVLLRSSFVDTEGASIAQNSFQFRIMANARTVADDGMELPLYKSYYANTFDELPGNKQVKQDMEWISNTLSALKKAPVADTYAGPAILDAAAAGVFFHEFFGHRLEGARMKLEASDQTFKKKIGEQVLADDISVYFDPQLRTYKETPLSGGYVFDDEGMRGRRVDVVANGVLKDFLMSRTPIDGHPVSNGHGRGQIYYAPVTRQSNMIVETSRPKTDRELREMLVKELKSHNKPYGYRFCEVSGGFTNISRIDANAFYVTPLVVYRVYADGRQDELVRGVNLVGTPLSIFSQIGGCGDDHVVFNGYCGAESGSIPVSAVAPSLFVKIIETQRQEKSQELPPLLNRP